MYAPSQITQSDRTNGKNGDGGLFMEMGKPATGQSGMLWVIEDGIDGESQTDGDG